MIVSYYEYNRLTPEMEFFIDRMNDLNYRYYASDLLQKLIHSTDFDLDSSIRKTIAILKLTGNSVQNHISRVYRSEFPGVRCDWKLSELACSLIILSYESSNKDIEEAQHALLDYLGL